jgi:hypothetical protein
MTMASSRREKESVIAASIQYICSVTVTILGQAFGEKREDAIIQNRDIPTGRASLNENSGRDFMNEGN